MPTLLLKIIPKNRGTKFLVFILASSFSLNYAFSQSACINLNGNPANQFFIDQFKNAPEDSFIAQWKKTLPSPSQASICNNCNEVQPQASSLSNSSIPLSAISTDVAIVQLKPRIKIEKSFFGSYFYRDQNGNKVSLSKEQAFQMMSEIQSQDAKDQLNQEIEETTKEKLRESLNEISNTTTTSITQQRTDQFQNLTGPDYTPRLENQCVQRSLQRLRPGQTNKRACASDSGNGRVMMTVPCITNEISNYITWSMNQAFNCINDPSDPMNLSLFFKKINLESNFNFWAEHPNTGRGIGQMTFTAMQEVMGYGYDSANERNFKYDGRKMLERILKSNPKCEPFQKIANPNLGANQTMFPRPHNSNICALTSMNEGLQRNLIASIALYKFYRDEQKTYSSEKVMKDLGIPRNNPDYSEMKNLLALMSYSKISPQNTRAIALMMKSQIKKDIRLSNFKKLLIDYTNSYNQGKEENLKVPNYIRSIENKFNDITDSGETLICTN